MIFKETSTSNHFYSELTTIYSQKNGFQNNFDQMPSEVQMALFDMIFNLGATKLQKLFLKFNDAIKKENWADAATECNRPDVSPSRNNYVKQLLTTANRKPTATAPQSGP
ncbi:hypothetical protein [Microbulbifer halophilus]|uniref:hypothetical protein n=1 Tax=Microbulbifer halophilus TaxID=453963 RepID=UPI00361E6CF1